MISPPPPPVPRSLWNKRWAEGKRTIKELDPAFYAWHERASRQNMLMHIGLATGAVLMVIGSIVWALICLVRNT